jgi:CubicO group peptidase (beta-lactamase class C family)
MPTRRAFLLSPVALFAARVSASSNVEELHRVMATLLAEKQAAGAALAVTRGGTLIHAAGYGVADVAKGTPVRPDALFRIASISKPITAVGVMQQVERGKVKLDDPVLKYVDLKPSVERGKEADARLKAITVRHCLQHTAGWDRAKSGDPIGMVRRIAEQLEIDGPPPVSAVIRYTLGRPLDFDPGERHAYSNVGYLLLGRVIEAASGRKYEEYVQKEILAPVGVTGMSLARALPEKRPAAEVAYHDPVGIRLPCIYPPRVGERVPIADGVMNVEAFEAHGGWVSSAPDLVKFAAAFDDPKRCKLLSAESIQTMWERPPHEKGTGYYACGWVVRPVGDGGKVNAGHGGALSPGTSTSLVRRHTGVNWAVLFNQFRGADGKVLANEADARLAEAVAKAKGRPRACALGYQQPPPSGG